MLDYLLLAEVGDLTTRFCRNRRHRPLRDLILCVTVCKAACIDYYWSLVVLATPEPLTKVEELLGIKGKTMRVPSIIGRPSVDVPLLFLIILGVLLYIGGPRAVVPLIAIGYFLMTASPNRS